MQSNIFFFSVTTEKEEIVPPYKPPNTSHSFYIEMPSESITKGKKSKCKEIERAEENTLKWTVNILSPV